MSPPAAPERRTQHGVSEFVRRTSLGFRVRALAGLALATSLLAPGTPAAEPTLLWTTPATPFTNDLATVAYGGGRWVAGGGSLLVHSADGLTWKPALVEPAPESIREIAWGDGRWLAAGTNAFLTSTDGETWSRQVVAFDPTAIAFGGGLWVAVGDTPVDPSQGIYDTGFWTSSDGGAHWDKRFSMRTEDRFLNAASQFKSPTYGSSNWTALLQTRTGARVNTTLLASSQGTEWSGVGEIFPLHRLENIAFGDGLWVSAGLGRDGNGPTPAALFSTNGIAWQYADTTHQFFMTAMQRIRFGAGRWLILSGNNAFLNSNPRLPTWSLTLAATNTVTLADAAFGNDRWIVVGNGGTIAVGQRAAGFVQARIEAPGSVFAAELEGPVGRTWRIQFSSDFEVWTDLASVTNTAGPVTFRDPVPSTGAPRFYRAITP